MGNIRRTVVKLHTDVLRAKWLAPVLLMLAASGCGFVGNGTSGKVPQSLTILTPNIPAATVNSNYSASLTASGGTAPYNWSIVSGSLPAGVFLTSSTGAISGSPKQTGTSSFKVQVEDSSSPLNTATQAFTLNVTSNSSSLQITTFSLASGTVSQSYSVDLSATGGTAPYSWAVSSGSLPAGLALSSSGKISGTPTASGTFPVGFSVTDSSSPAQSASKSFSLQVDAGGSNSGLQITTTSLPTGLESQPYSATLTASGGTQPYTWSLASNSGSLPQGLSLAATSGDISGTPGTTGQTTVTFQVTDSSPTPQSGTKTLTFFISGGNLDLFGGRMDRPCTVPATGGWSTTKINNQWYLCTPGGHALWLQDVENIIWTDSTAQAIVTSRYGGVPQWTEATLARLNAWGFNALGEYSYAGVLPTYRNNSLPNGQHTIKLPFMSRVRPGFYSVRNPSVTLATGGSAPLLDDPSKDMMGARSSFYNDFTPGGGVMDYGDSKIFQWLASDLSQDIAFSDSTNPDNIYRIGFSIDDGDELWGIITGPDFTSNPPGHNSAELPLMVISESPVQWASQQQQHVYQDGVMHSKQMLHDALVAKYGTIGALNQAWGSNYTTFDSSGTPVTATLCTSDGSNSGCSATLSQVVISAYSIRISANGQTIAGDIGSGQIWGPSVSGTVNYTTGAVSVTFASGQIPPNGTVISISYVQNGWGIGTGLMDEDMRTSHQAWLGNTWDGISAMNGGTLQPPSANVQADLNAFWKEAAGWYFQQFATEVHAKFPTALIVSDLSAWDVPPPAPVLEAEAPYVDIEHMSETSGASSQAILDYIFQHFGDKPIIGDMFLAADADSDLSAFANGGIPTQTARGQQYLSDVQGMLAARNSAGINPHIGLDLWDWMDLWSEKTNWGLVSHLDNAYDGHEDVSASVTCSAPIQKYTCGGEPGNYGDYITYVKQGNLIWLTH